MRNFKIYFSLFFALGFILSFSACTEDPCENTTCGANGVPQEDVLTNLCFCLCDEGWSGAACDEPDTPPCDETNCVNGECQEDGTCLCAEGFTGPECTCGPDVCINGTCQDDGTCLCDDGYEGEDCSTEKRAKFVGTWEATETCTSGAGFEGCIEDATFTYPINIAGNGTNLSSLVMDNFFGADDDGDQFFEGGLVIELLNDTDFEWTYQASQSEFYNYFSSGTGTLVTAEDGTQSIETTYKVDLKDADDITECSVDCTAVWVKL